MTWTRDRPVLPGWYWFKAANSSHIVEIYKSGRQETLHARWIGFAVVRFRLRQCLVSKMDGEWSGPLMPPG